HQPDRHHPGRQRIDADTRTPGEKLESEETDIERQQDRQRGDQRTPGSEQPPESSLRRTKRNAIDAGQRRGNAAADLFHRALADGGIHSAASHTAISSSSPATPGQARPTRAGYQ